MGAFGNANFLANPTAYTFVLVCSCLNALTLVFASFKLHRLSPLYTPISPLFLPIAYPRLCLLPPAPVIGL